MGRINTIYVKCNLVATIWSEMDVEAFYCIDDCASLDAVVEQCFSHSEQPKVKDLVVQSVGGTRLDHCRGATAFRYCFYE